jgi:hypothetical protein
MATKNKLHFLLNIKYCSGYEDKPKQAFSAKLNFKLEIISADNFCGKKK